METSITTENINKQIQKYFSNSAKVVGCPICSMIMDYEFNFISKIQYAVSNEKKTREEIAAEGGFCDFHFRQFKKIANGKTNILLLKSIIEVGAYKRKNFSVNCRICLDIDVYESEIIKSLSYFITDQNFRLNFESSIGICFNHLQMVTIRLEDKKIIEWLIDTHIKQIELMHKDFDDMSKIKSFYEIDRDKRKLINILIEKLAGRKTRSL